MKLWLVPKYTRGMFAGDDWIVEWPKAEALSLRMREICATIPLRGTWEPNDRIAFAMASFRLAQEHHASIHLLFGNNKPSSANALARPLLEAALRVVWIAEEASNQEISALANGRESVIPLLGELITLVSKGSEITISGRHRGLLDNLTHGGGKAMAAQFLGGEKLERLSAAMIAQAGLALFAAGYTIAQLLGRQDLLAELINGNPILGSANETPEM
jgi:hypothetical protein